jgi:histidinol phosphatase-like PHP family hydrolase
MSVLEKSITDTVRSYIGGLAHVHTRLSNHAGHHESDLTVNSLVAMLGALEEWTPGKAPLEYILINEHSSNPDRPHPLGRLSLRARELLRERRRSASTIPMFYGLEVSLLSNGKTDLVPRLADNCALVIASRHRLPIATERDPSAIMELFQKACANPAVDVLGHPSRNIEDVTEVNWPQVFEWAAVSGTAVEVNLNNFPKSGVEAEARLEFWKNWIRKLGESEARVFIGTDLHNTKQVERFREQWRGLDDGKPNLLRSIIEILKSSDVMPERVVNSNLQRLLDWTSLDKSARAQLFLKQSN